MKYMLFFIPLCLALGSCRQGSRNYLDVASDSTRVVTAVSPDAISLAPRIIYDVTVKNPDPDDQWTTECLQDLDLKTLVDLVFDAVYQGRLKAWEYHEERPMEIDEVRALEQDPEFDRSRIARVQFTEDWYFDREKLCFTKRVKSIMLAYEVYDLQGKVRGYKSAFQVFLNP